MELMLLSDMLAQLRLEARISSDVSHASHLRERYVALLQRTQKEVYDAYDWPHLNTVQSVTVAAAQRYSAFPDKIDYTGIRRVFQQNTSGDWQPLGYGITAEFLNDVDSDAGETRQNIEQWQNYLSLASEDVHQNMFEVWPVPSRDVAVRFEGKRKLLPLVENTDKSTVDGVIIVLHAAAELLAAQKAEDAGLKLQKAQTRFDLMRQRAAAPAANAQIIIPNNGSRGSSGGQRFRVR